MFRMTAKSLLISLPAAVAFTLLLEGSRMSQEHYCKFTRSIQPNNGSICLGCGSDLTRCKQDKPKRKTSECPGCTHHGPHKEIEAERYRCLKCGAIFEKPDFGYVDERPDVNAEKLERIERDKRKRGGYKR